jgi:ABC-type sugar transport system ATPase subunit
VTSIKLEQVYKSYEKTEILKNINLEIEKGEFCVFVGPSGSGKSTILRLVAGFEKATEGKILFDGKNVNDLTPGDRELGMVFQNYALFANMTVEDNLSFGLRLKRFAKDKLFKRLMDTAKMFQIEPYLKRLPKQLSGGQRQRVALGRAVMRHPSLILMDEPLSNLDALLRVQTRSEIVRTVKELGTTVVYVTHDQVEALSMADKLVVLKDGQIQQIGSPVEVYQKPATSFVATFFGSPSMNLFTGFKVKEAGNSLILDNETVQIKGISGLNIPNQTEVIIGIRPEDITFEEKQGLAPLPGQVVHIENLGAEKLVYLNVCDTKIIVRLGAYDKVVDIHSQIQIFINQDRIHYFDVKTGMRL